MKKVSVFIAGSTKLREETNRIKSVISDLDFRYSSRSFRIETSNYSSHGDCQQNYNDYIKNEADVVIFVLKGSIGAITEEEYLVAMDSLSTKGRPEVYVFVDPEEESSPEYQHLLEVIRSRMLNEKKYYIRYNGVEDLAYKVRARLDDYLLRREKNPRRGLLFGWITAAVLALLFVFVMRERPEVIYAGGGSVANMLKAEIGLDVNKDISLLRRSVHLPIASGSAWMLLSEDINLHMLQKEPPTDSTGIKPKKNRIRCKHRTLCLSAGKMDMGVLEGVADAKTKGECAIIECYLGKDPLVAYISHELFETMKNPSDTGQPRISDKAFDSSGHLTSYGLVDILENAREKKLTVFATAMNSGTRKMFYTAASEAADTMMVKSILYNDHLIKLYNESSSSALVSQEGISNSYVVLGSKYYRLNSIMDKRRYVLDMLEMDSFKDMYIYFIAYKDSNSNNQIFVIPDEYMPILNKLHKAGRIPERWVSIQNGKIGFGPGEGDSVVNGWNVIRIGKSPTPSQ